jgi:FMN phosphatase YigB (HAD superfamily)
MINAVVFKLRNVLAFINREKAYRAIAEHVPHDAEEVGERIEKSGLIEKVNRNELKDAQFFLEVMNLFDPPHSLEFSDFYTFWGDVFTTNRGLLKFLPRLRDDLQLILMADLSVIELESFLEKHPEVLEPFGQKVIYSTESGVSAPDSAFYMKALEIAEVEREAKSVLYVDANLENVSAATQVGMKGHHYVGLLEFVADLKRMELMS